MHSKTCENCGTIFFKGPTRSVRDFMERARFCSNACKVYKQTGFYKHWQGRRRPDLVDTPAAATMFQPGQRVEVPSEKRHRTHGMANTTFYRRWLAMGQRCTNPKFKQYKDYGGRGVVVEWPSFEEFLADMYESFCAHVAEHGMADTTIDRIDNDGNYSRTNCRWATRAEQAGNRHRKP